MDFDLHKIVNILAKERPLLRNSERFAAALGISSGGIYDIEQQHRNVHSGVNYWTYFQSLLETWIQSRTPENATLSELVKILTTNGFNNAAYLLKEFALENASNPATTSSRQGQSRIRLGCEPENIDETFALLGSAGSPDPPALTAWEMIRNPSRKCQVMLGVIVVFVAAVIVGTLIWQASRSHDDIDACVANNQTSPGGDGWKKEPTKKFAIENSNFSLPLCTNPITLEVKYPQIFLDGKDVLSVKCPDHVLEVRIYVSLTHDQLRRLAWSFCRVHSLTFVEKGACTGSTSNQPLVGGADQLRLTSVQELFLISLKGCTDLYEKLYSAFAFPKLKLIHIFNLSLEDRDYEVLKEIIKDVEYEPKASCECIKWYDTWCRSSLDPRCPVQAGKMGLYTT